MTAGRVLPSVIPVGSAAWAVQTARGALGAGQPGLAIAWLQRADRLAPNDATIHLLLAAATMPTDPLEAVAILQALTRRLPLHRDAGIGLAAALLRSGQPAEAAFALGQLLARTSPPKTTIFSREAAAICVASGSPGWLWLDSSGHCHVHLAASAGIKLATIALTLDGHAMANVKLRPGHSAVLPLPPEWRSARTLTAECRAGRLIGSGLSPARFGVTLGFVAADRSGVRGWARCPSDCDTPPSLFLQRANGELSPVPVVAEPDAARLQGSEWQGPRWWFALAGTDLTGLETARIVDAACRNLWGSPILLNAEREATGQAATFLGNGRLPAQADRYRPLPAALLPAPARPGKRRHSQPHCDVIVPIYDGLTELDACLASLHATLPKSSNLVLVIDGAPDPAVAARAQAAAGPRVTVLDHGYAQGFPAAVNTGLAHLGLAADRDVVILNSDTVVAPHWLDRLSAVAHSDAAIGSATPLTNDGTLVSYPEPGVPADPPDAAALTFLNDICWTANGTGAVDIPTGVGFCMLLKGACLVETGLFRADVFAQGYGEENDWCLRAAHLGWRHVAATGLFVAHSGGRSFGAAKTLLMERNADILERLHPGYARYVQQALATDPLLAARGRIDRQMLLRSPGTGSVALVTHDAGGGVERHVARRCAAITAAGQRPIVLAPGTDGSCRLTIGAGDGARPLPNLHFDLPAELDALATLLAEVKVARMEIHHLLRHDATIATLPARLGVPYDVIVHDYGTWCPRISLIGRGQRYCGEPLALDDCEQCVADLGSRYADGITVLGLRAHSAAMLAGARQVTVACTDVAARIGRQFPGIQPAVQAWEDPLPAAQIAPAPSEEVHVVVVGAIGIEKGFDVLLGCARDAARRNLPLRFTVVGHTIGDDRLLATGHAFVTGRFTEAEGLGLLRRQRATAGFVPSVCPETWCYALSLLWQANLPVLAFALGAQGERIGASDRGWLVPLGLPVAKINDALVSRNRHLYT